MAATNLLRLRAVSTRSLSPKKIVRRFFANQLRQRVDIQPSRLEFRQGVGTPCHIPLHHKLGTHTPDGG